MGGSNVALPFTVRSARTWYRLGAAGLTGVLLCWASAAAAQPSDCANHSGPTASVGLGGGYSADVAGGGIATTGAIDVGWFVTARLGLLIGLASVTRGSDEKIVHSMLHIGAEYRLTADWYLRAAVGSLDAARLGPDRGDGVVHSAEVIELFAEGAGWLVAAGHPVFASRRLAVNIEIAAGGGLPSDDATSTARFVATYLGVAFR